MPPSLPRTLRIAYLAHTLRSDWNNGNAHFLRGLLRALGTLGHQVTAFEPASEWSIDNLRQEPLGEQSLADFAQVYSDLRIHTYAAHTSDEYWAQHLNGFDVVLLHEWNPPGLAAMLLRLRPRLGYALLFHDTHHRASSTPEQMERFGLAHFDGIVAFGDSLRSIYRDRWGLSRVWTLHEAADVSVFHPHRQDTDTGSNTDTDNDVVWVGNWGEGERAAELREFLVRPAAALAGRTTVFGVRYPPDGLAALAQAGIAYGGYLPNLQAPAIYGRASMTLHVPRQQYSGAMCGIPTIRVFEALACGIPLLSAPWQDTESLFRPGDFQFVGDGAEMAEAIRAVVREPEQAAERAARGLETVLARHTCAHRAAELTAILEAVMKDEVLA